MIQYALTRKTETEEKLKRFSVSSEAKWFHPSIYLYTLELSKDTWASLELIAVHNGSVQGFMKARIDREVTSITQLALCKFHTGNELQLATDISTVFSFLRTHFRTIRWSCVSGSPLTKMYEKIAADQGGTFIGGFINSVRLMDGSLADEFWFEVPGNTNPDGITYNPEWNYK